MEVYRISSRLFLLLGILCLVITLQGVQGRLESEGPSESECRPYIEKALKELETAEATGPIAPGDSGGESKEEEEKSDEEEVSTVEITADDSDHTESDGDNDIEAEDSKESTESAAIDEAEDAVSKEEFDDDHSEEEKSEETSSEVVTSAENEEDKSEEEQSEGDQEEQQDQEESEESRQSAEIEKRSVEDEDGSDETDDKTESAEVDAPPENKVEDADGDESAENDESSEVIQESTEAADEEGNESEEYEQPQGDEPESQEDKRESAETDAESQEDKTESAEAETESTEDIKRESAEEPEQESAEEPEQESAEEPEQDSAEEIEQESAEGTEQESAEEVEQESAEAKQESEEQTDEGTTITEDDSSSEDEKPGDEADVSASAEKGESAEDEEPNIVDEEDAAEAGDDVSKETAESAESIEEKEEDADNGDGDTDTITQKDDDKIQKDGSSEETDTEKDTIETSEVEEEKLEEDASENLERIKREAEKSGSDEEGLEEMVGQDEEIVESQEEEKEDNKEKEMTPEEELINEGEIPDNLRSTDHIWQLLKLDDDNLSMEKIMNGIAEITLRDLKRLYETAIKPLETLYKYRDLSNRHFGDSEIFSKPLVLFMGPWSGGKSSIINYLLNNEYNETSLRTGAEPSPAYFNILTYGEEPEVLDGTQLVADFTFSGLQKFGQGLEERLRGLKLPQKLLQKINIVEIPGILEVRKQISRVFPFNDACQWFIDRADIIYLVYDPSKLDVGPETEAILDQLKGREHQTRIILNKADQVKPEELMRVQGALIWNISPLMSSAQPPVMYTTSLWSRPYESGAPVRLLQAQERAFLRDLRSAVDKRIENKIASARRFAVRVRNHAKMVDCYLTTYYNHKSVFGNRKQVADAIIEHPQDYHIYEGLSTLTNISRYDLPDPDVYRDFFRLNALYDFQQLSATCTYFRGCPINRLDVAIAYDLPELIGKHKRMVETALTEANLSQTPGS